MQFVDLIFASTAFVLIFLAELGDKTQLTCLTLACQFPPKQVFLGSLLGILLIDGLSIILGASITAFIPPTIIMLTAGFIFLAFGVQTLRSKNDNTIKDPNSSRNPIITSFYMMALGELGDKTQIASIALAAEIGIESAFLGVMSAFIVLIALGVFLGAKVFSRLPRRWVTVGSAAFFMIMGALSILSTFFGMKVF